MTDNNNPNAADPHQPYQPQQPTPDSAGTPVEQPHAENSRGYYGGSPMPQPPESTTNFGANSTSNPYAPNQDASGTPQNGYANNPNGYPSQQPAAGGNQYGNYGAQPAAGGNQYGNYGAQPAYGSAYTAGSYAGAGGQQMGSMVGYNELLRANMIQRSSGIGIMDAISYGFKATFSQKLPWILGALVFGIVLFVFVVLAGAMQGTDPSASQPSVLNYLVMIPLLLVYPIVIAASLVQIDGVSISWSAIKAKMNYVQGLIALVLSSVITQVPQIIIGRLLTPSSDLTRLSPEELASYATTMLMVSLLSIVIGTVIGIFVMFAPYLAVESRTSGIDSISASAKVAVRNFLGLLGYTVLIAVIVAAGSLVTLGIGFLILGPAAVNSMAHVYRQATQAPYPEM